MSYQVWLLKIFWILQAIGGSVVADETLDSNKSIAIDRQAIAILNRECVACHGSKKQEGSLALNDRVGLVKGGDHGSALSGNGESLLLIRLEHPDRELQMPPRRALSHADIATLKAWIHSGASWPATIPETHARADAWTDPNNPIRQLFSGKRLDHWSLKPISKPKTPEVKNAKWCNNAIDRFVLAEWERDGLIPAPSVDDRTFALRTSMDMVGLPQDHETIRSFTANNSPNKHSEWIETLLQSPSFGAHWARMWLDAVRYSDSNGFDWDEYRPDAWRYRDYVVQAFNSDLPYDSFIEQQLAGDELLAGLPQNIDEQRALLATGYLRLGPQDNAASLFNEQDRARAELMADLTETTASAFMGLTFSCCRCHDHKTDPFSQEDHYRLRAFFSACHIPENSTIELEHVQMAARSHNEEIDKKIAATNERITQLLDNVRARSIEKLNDKQVKVLFSEVEKSEWKKLDSEVKSLNQQKLPLARGLLMTDKIDSPPTYVFSQGDHRQPKKAVEAGFPSIMTPHAANIVQSENKATTGRRLTLARWIASKNNPWTARVIVNRLWQGYFGQGIVSTPNDFGVTGASPSNPELLDFLAAELIENGWSLKHIHRLIVTSSTYRQQTLSKKKSVESRLGSLRSELRRLSAEQFRDSILFVSDMLQIPAGGPPVWPEVDAQTLAANPAVLDDNETKTKGWYPSSDSKQTIRSLYLIQKRTIKLPFMETFDLPESTTSCGRRETSLVAPQALTLMNGPLTETAASEIAKLAARREFISPKQIVNFCFERILSRQPGDTELLACEYFLRDHSVPELCMVLLNCNEFAFVE